MRAGHSPIVAGKFVMPDVAPALLRLTAPAIQCHNLATYQVR